MTAHPAARLTALAFMLAFDWSALGAAQDRPARAEDRSDVGFLKIGRSYLIRFPEGYHPVQAKESGFTAQPSGPPAAWKANYQNDVFVVRRLGGGSWVLLEHPADPKAALDVASARNLLADQAKVAEIEADPNRKDFLAQRREAARSEVKVTRTWINLAHAISIADPPAEQRWDVKFNVGPK